MLDHELSDAFLNQIAVGQAEQCYQCRYFFHLVIAELSQGDALSVWEPSDSSSVEFEPGSGTLVDQVHRIPPHAGAGVRPGSRHGPNTKLLGPHLPSSRTQARG